MILDILTPLGPKRSATSIHAVEAPAYLGEIGILPGHVPFVSPIVPGVVRFREGEQSIRIAVGSGFLEVTEDGHVSILVDRALEANEIDVSAVRSEHAELAARLTSEHASLDDMAHLHLREHKAWLDAQLRAAGS